MIGIIIFNHHMQNRQKQTHLERENGLKPHFGPFQALTSPFLGQQIFFQHLDSHQVLNIVILNHNMQNRQKLMHFEQDNGLKPHFGPFLALNGPFQGQQIFFQHFSHHQVLDLLTLDHITQNRQKLMYFEQQNGLKPHFGPFLALIGPFLGQQIFFSTWTAIRYQISLLSIIISKIAKI